MTRKPQRPVTPELRRQIWRFAKQGLSTRAIGAEVGRNSTTVQYVLAPLGGVIRRDAVWEPCGVRLTIEDRIEVKVGIEAGESFRAIATRLGRSPSTISREVSRNGGRRGYMPVAAHRRAFRCSKRPKPSKLSLNPALRQRVTDDLAALWSPEEITGRLRADFGDDPSMNISHETIYKSLFVQGRGELRRELARCLRTGRTARRPQNRLETRGRIPDMVPIRQRPAEADDRAVAGHWEGDLIIGANNNSAVGTLVERSTRFVMLLHLPRGASAVEVREAMTAKIVQLPEALRRSITWDQGKEMAQHVRFTVDTGVAVYFCDPHSPWQRGSNENTNGLLRQYMPKGTSLKGFSAEDLDRIADSLNGRPRKTLGFMTPSEKLAELLH